MVCLLTRYGGIAILAYTTFVAGVLSNEGKEQIACHWHKIFKHKL